MKNLFMISFLLVLFSSSFIGVQGTEGSLRMVIEVTRHGARSPLYDNFTTSVWDAPPGVLTGVGMREHYLLGRELRKRYMIDHKFLNRSFDQEEIQIYSTDSTRTILSAQSQLLGLYYDSGLAFNRSKMNPEYVVPPIEVSDWEEMISELGNWALPFRFEPVPIRPIPDQYNKILTPGSVCPKIKDIVKENFLNEDYLIFERKLREMGFYQQFGEIFKVDAGNFSIEQTQQYLDIITMNMFDSRELPEGYTQEFDDMMNFAYCYRQFYLWVGNSSVLPFYVSGFFENMLMRFDEKINGSNTKLKWEYFSAHDNNLIYLLEALGLMTYTTDYEEFLNPTKYFSYRDPPPASLLLFELHEIEGEFYVRVLYNDRVMILEGCEEVCAYEKFKSLGKKLILDDYDTACGLEKTLPRGFKVAFLRRP